MVAALYVVAFAMVLGGSAFLVRGVPFISVEWGWAMVIAGTVAASSGVLLAGITAVLSRLHAIENELAASRERAQLPEQAPAPSRPELSERMPEREAEPAHNAVFAADGAPVVVASVPVASEIIGEPVRPVLTEPTARPDAERASAGSGPRPVAPRPPFPAVAVEAADQPAWLDFPEPERRSDAKAGLNLADSSGAVRIQPTRAVPLEEPAPAPPIDEPAPPERSREGLASPSAVSHALVAPTVDTLPPAAPVIAEPSLAVGNLADNAPTQADAAEPSRVAPPNPDDPTSLDTDPANPSDAAVEEGERLVIGTYSSGGNSYVMYSDGSIEAETPTGHFRFQSLDELKDFIASGGERSVPAPA